MKKYVVLAIEDGKLPVVIKTCDTYEEAVNYVTKLGYGVIFEVEEPVND